MTKVTLDLDANERNHLKKAVTSYYARMILAEAEPGVMSPTDQAKRSSQSLFGKVNAAVDAVDSAP